MREVDGKAAVQRVHVTLQRGAGAESDDRRVVSRANSNGFHDLLARLGEKHGVRRRFGVQVSVWPC